MTAATAAPTALSELSSALERIAREQGPAVVGVGVGWRVGSGTVVGPGKVLTAAHRAANEPTVSFAGGREAAARLVAADRDLDIAVLAVDTGDTDPLEWAPSDPAVRVGAPVVALGNPGGRGLRTTPGFVAAVERSFRGQRGRRVSGAVEHTAPLPRGSAGGPLVDVDGRLLGVNLLRLEGGLIIAPSVAGGLRESAQRLMSGQEPVRPRLGVAVAPPRIARRIQRAVGLPERDGVLVRAVEEGSPAARAGIGRGDLIVAVGGRAVRGVEELHGALDDATEGARLALRLVRGTEEREIEVELERRGA